MSHGIIASVEVPISRKRVYYVLSALTWDSTTSHKIVVPTGVRWKVLCATLKNDANETAAIYWLDSTDVVIAQLATQAANTGRTTWPNTAASATIFNSNGDLIMDPGEKIHFNSGGAQGAGAYIYLQVLEVVYV